MRNTKITFRLTLLGVFLLGLLLARDGIEISQYFRHPPYPQLAWLWDFLAWGCQSVLPEIGKAMIIAPILAILVDAAAKQNLLAEFARDVSIHIIGRYLPRELRDHIHGYLTVDIVRLDLNLVYTIIDLNAETVELQTEATSDLHNYSVKEIETDIFVAVSKCVDPAKGQTMITEVTAGDFTYRHGDDPKNLKSAGSDEVYITKLRLPAPYTGSLPHGTRCMVKSREFFSPNGETAYIAVFPVLGATVTVIRPEGYEVSLDLTFTQDNVKPPTPEEAPGRCRWRIESPILQGQGFFVRWKKTH